MATPNPAPAPDEQVRIRHAETDQEAVVMRESLPVWEEIGWTEVVDQPPQSPQNVPLAARTAPPQNPAPAPAPGA